MPVYEFYCPDCHRIFNFLSRRVNTRKRPRCPRCDRPKLDRQVSIFAISKGRSEPDAPELPDVDPHKLEQAMASLASEAEGMQEDDPRQMGRLLRKVYEATGLGLNDGLEEALGRLEAGEDPESVEADLGDALSGEDDPLAAGTVGQKIRNLRRTLPPAQDDELYDL